MSKRDNGAVRGGSESAAAAAAAARGSESDVELKEPCPICLDNEEDATLDGQAAGMCMACGQRYCGGCNTTAQIGQVLTCPTCRATLRVSDEEQFKRCYKLVHGRSAGRHTIMAQWNLGIMYQNGTGVPQDSPKAAECYTRAADQGHVSAQCKLGYIHSHGLGVPEDYTKAVKYYTLAAQQGDVNAYFNLGNIYAKGEGVPRDHKEAKKYYTLAAEQGDGQAQHSLAHVYYTGRNYAEALKYYTLAADQGYANAQYNVGRMYNHGEGVPQDYARAMRYYTLAADQGNADATCNIGGMHFTGRGAPQNLDRAVKWFQLAAERGQPIAIKTLDQLQEANSIPTLPPGTCIATTLLTSAKHNKRAGIVAERATAAAANVKPGRVAVLLEGEAKPISFKLKNLLVME